MQQITKFPSFQKSNISRTLYSGTSQAAAGVFPKTFSVFLPEKETF